MTRVRGTEGPGRTESGERVDQNQPEDGGREFEQVLSEKGRPQDPPLAPTLRTTRRRSGAGSGPEKSATHEKGKETSEPRLPSRAAGSPERKIPTEATRTPSTPRHVRQEGRPGGHPPSPALEPEVARDVAPPSPRRGAEGPQTEPGPSLQTTGSASSPRGRTDDAVPTDEARKPSPTLAGTDGRDHAVGGAGRPRPERELDETKKERDPAAPLAGPSDGGEPIRAFQHVEGPQPVAGPRVDPREIQALANRLVQAAQVQLVGNRTVVDLHLDLGPLGAAQVKLQKGGDQGLKIAFTVEAGARDRLALEIGDLREAFDARGIDVGQMEIHTPDGQLLTFTEATAEERRQREDRGEHGGGRRREPEPFVEDEGEES